MLVEVRMVEFGKDLAVDVEQGIAVDGHPVDPVVGQKAEGIITEKLGTEIRNQVV